MTKRILVTAAVTAGVSLAGFLVWTYFGGGGTVPVEKSVPATVATAEARSESWQPSLHAVGNLVARQGVHVSNEVPGIVMKIEFRSGQSVARDDLLVELDDDVDQADLEGLIAEQHLAQLHFDRTAELLKRQTVSRADYDDARARLESLKAQVAAKRAVIAKKKIRAPFSGQLGIREVNLGQYLAAGTPIVVLQMLDPIYVDYLLPEGHFDQLAVGQEVAVKVQAHPHRSFPGQVTAINPGVDTASRNVTVRATLDNPDHLLHPGMFAEVETLLPGRHEALTVPRTAVSYNPYGEMVFVVTHENGAQVVRQRLVQTGAVRGARVEIVKGLAAGDRVVSGGQNKLHNGQQVRIDNSVKLKGPVTGP